MYSCEIHSNSHNFLCSFILDIRHIHLKKLRLKLFYTRLVIAKLISVTRQKKKQDKKGKRQLNAALKIAAKKILYNVCYAQANIL